MASHFSILAWRIPMDRGVWRTAVYRITKSWTQLKQLSTHAHRRSLIFWYVCICIQWLDISHEANRSSGAMIGADSLSKDVGRGGHWLVSQYFHVSSWLHTGFCEFILPPGPANVVERDFFLDVLGLSPLWTPSVIWVFQRSLDCQIG